MFGSLVLYPQPPGLCYDLTKQLEELLMNPMGCILSSPPHDCFSGTLLLNAVFRLNSLSHRCRGYGSTLEPPCQSRSALPGDCLGLGCNLWVIVWIPDWLSCFLPSLLPAAALPPALLAFLNSFILSLLPCDLWCEKHMDELIFLSYIWPNLLSNDINQPIF